MESKMENKAKSVKKGTVISDKSDKTIVVLVERTKEHPKYHKKYKVSKKFKAHDEENQFKAGDIVEIEPVKPISKEKHYKALRKVESK